MPVTFSNIGLGEPSTITNRIAAVTILRGGTPEQQEILVLGDPESSLAAARVLNATPASTEYGLAVREIAPSTGPMAVSSVSGVVHVRLQDTAGVALAASTAAPASADNGLVVRQVGYVAPSTEVRVSTVQGRVLVDQNSTTWAVQVSSVAGAVTVRLQTSSGGALDGSTAAPSSGTLGLPVRPVAPPRRAIYSTVVSSASTAFYTVVSSVAQKIVARAYSITSTAVSPVLVTFHSGTNAALWGLLVGSGSSGVTGANLADPVGLFETASGEPLTVRLSTTGVEVHIAVAASPEA